MGASSLDWPLSREEQKKHVLRLYDKDVKAANELLISGEAAFQALREELRVVRSTASSSGNYGPGATADLLPPQQLTLEEQPPRTPPRQPLSTAIVKATGASAAGKDLLGGISRAFAAPASADGDDDDHGEDAERLQHAIANAAAALAALLGAASAAEARNVVGDGSMEARQRARSEGAARMAAAMAEEAAKTQRGGLSRGDKRQGSRRRRVSFSEVDQVKEVDEIKLQSISPAHLAGGEPEPPPDDPLTPEKESSLPPALEDNPPLQQFLPAPELPRGGQQAKELVVAPAPLPRTPRDTPPRAHHQAGEAERRSSGSRRRGRREISSSGGADSSTRLRQSPSCDRLEWTIVPHGAVAASPSTEAVNKNFAPPPVRAMDFL